MKDLSIDYLVGLLQTPTNFIGAAIVSTVISFVVGYYFKRKEISFKARMDYEYEQRKKSQELIGRYHGRLVSSANELSSRFWNLHENWGKGWLDLKGDYSDPQYYFMSTAYRLMSFFALIRMIETEAILLDGRTSTKKDVKFLDFVAAFKWVITDVDLYKGIPYNNFHASEHFFSDDLRRYAELCFLDKTCLTYTEFKRGPMLNSEFAPVLKFIDGLAPRNGQLRWDRLVVLHLLLLAFLNKFGYPRQRTNFANFFSAVQQIQSRAILVNLKSWLPELCLNSVFGLGLLNFAVNISLLLRISPTWVQLRVIPAIKRFEK